MDGRHLDALARLAAVGASRRRVAAAGLALALLGRLPREALAACKKVGQQCDKNGDCCPHAECKGGKCNCNRLFTECGGCCFNLDADRQHCGTCDVACAADEACCHGACVDLQSDADNCGACQAACATGQTCCGGKCFDLQGDGSHCGRCAKKCAAAETCCVGACANLRTDEANCGACGAVCPHGQTCCGGACFDTETDRAHCGACNRACTNTEICVDGGAWLAHLAASSAATSAASPADADRESRCEPGHVAGASRRSAWPGHRERGSDADAERAIVAGQGCAASGLPVRPDSPGRAPVVLATPSVPAPAAPPATNCRHDRTADAATVASRPRATAAAISSTARRSRGR